MAADAPSVISGYLQLKARGKSWQRRWFALHNDFVLYSFRSHVDHSAVTATPVPGYTIAKVTYVVASHDIVKCDLTIHNAQ